MERAAYTPKEFAALFGKSQTWGYRQIYSGKVTSTTEHGRTLIPAHEVDKVLQTAQRKGKPAKKAAAPKPAKPASVREMLIRGSQASTKGRNQHGGMPARKTPKG